MTTELLLKLYRKQTFRKRINTESFCNDHDYCVNAVRSALYKHATTRPLPLAKGCLPF